MTQTAQHTQGPWKVLEILDGIAIKDNRNVTIAYCDYATDADAIEIAEAETEANARVISAAPEMLEALELVAMLDLERLDATNGAAARHIVRAAIAKATG